jgi:hypothetical protein
MMHVFRFVLENYDFKYLLKTDDDAFVRPDRLLNYYRYFNPRRTYIGTYRIFKETTLPYSRRPQVYAGECAFHSADYEFTAPTRNISLITLP